MRDDTATIEGFLDYLSTHSGVERAELKIAVTTARGDLLVAAHLLASQHPMLNGREVLFALKASGLTTMQVPVPDAEFDTDDADGDREAVTA